MYKLSLEITNSCNLRCKYCYIGEKHHDIINKEVIAKAIDIAYREALKHNDKTLLVYFIGGEPLMAFDKIIETVEYIEEKNKKNELYLRYSITTNGTLLNEEIIDFFIAKNFDIKLSIDGNKFYHDMNRTYQNQDGTYDTIIEKKQLIKKYENITNKVICVAHVVTTNNFEYMCENMFHLVELGFWYIETGFNTYTQWTKKQIDGLREQIEKTYYRYKKQRIEGENIYFSFIEKYGERIVKPRKCFFSCKAGLVSIYVTVQGDIYPCFRSDEDICLGNVLQDLNIHKIRELASISDTENKACRKCECYDFCHTCDCIMGNYDVNNNFFVPTFLSCSVEKIMLNILVR